MRKRTWKIIDLGEVPENAPTIMYGGPCGHEALLPVKGMAIAELPGGGVIFDIPSEGRMPAVIHCRKCRRTYTNARED